MKFYALDQINQAAEDSEKGISIKPIVRIGSQSTLRTKVVGMSVRIELQN